MLTIIHLDPTHQEVRADMTDVCRMHGRVLSLLGLDPDEPKTRELWATPRPDRLIVQHHKPADLRWLPDGYSTSSSVHDVRTDWPAGSHVQWAMIVNPAGISGRSTNTDGTPRRRPTSRRDPALWARTRLTMLDHHTVDLVESTTRRGRKPGRAVTIWQSRIIGTATVLDPPALAELIREGRGRAKAYGCGLLVLGETP